MGKNSEILKYLSAYLKNWIKSNGLTQAEASLRLNIQQAQLNGILNLTRGISIEKMESLCNVTRKNTIDALLEGKNLLGIKHTSDKKDELNYTQKNAMEAFRFLLVHGGEAADLIEKAVIDFAHKKQAEADLQNPTPAPQSKSA